MRLVLVFVSQHNEVIDMVQVERVNGHASEQQLKAQIPDIVKIYQEERDYGERISKVEVFSHVFDMEITNG